MAGRDGAIWRSRTRPEFLVCRIRHCLAISTKLHLSLVVNWSKVVSSSVYKPVFSVDSHSQYKKKSSAKCYRKALASSEGVLKEKYCQMKIQKCYEQSLASSKDYQRHVDQDARTIPRYKSIIGRALRIAE